MAKIHRSEYFTGESKRNNPRLREKLVEDIKLLKESSPCARCGMFFPHYVMDFDHTGQNKRFNISQACRYVWLEKVAQIWKEIKKCDIVCSNCHRIREHERGRQKVWRKTG
jgi:hypothetical protein